MPVTRWVFDLDKEMDPLVRLGIHGLWRVLFHVPGLVTRDSQERVPGRAHVEFYSASFTLEFSDLEELQHIVQGHLGDMQHGVLQLPGYPAFRTHHGYVNIFAQKVLRYFAAKKGPARTRSLSEPEQKALEQQTGHTVLTSWTYSGKEVRFQPYALAHLPSASGFKARDAFVFEVDKKGRSPVMTVHHPACTSWYNQSGSREASQAFALFFSFCGYAWTRAFTFNAKRKTTEMSSVGLGIDEPTFAAANAIHKTYSKKPLFLVNGGTSFAAWALVSHLRLKEGSYLTLGVAGGRAASSVLYVRAAPWVQTLCALVEGPLLSYADAARQLEIVKSSRLNEREYIADALVHNLTWGLPWYRRFNEVCYVENKGGSKGPYKSEAESLGAIMIAIDSQHRERSLLRAFIKRLYGKVLYRQQKIHGKNAFDKTSTLVERTHLASISSPATLQRALVELLKEAGDTTACIPLDLFEYMQKEARTNVEDLRTYMMLCCRVGLSSTQKESDRKLLYDALGWTFKPYEADEAEDTPADSADSADDTDTVDSDDNED